MRFLPLFEPDVKGLQPTGGNDSGEHLGLCPFHDDTRPSFNVNLESGLWRCFSCQAKGDAPGFLMRLKGLSFKEAKAGVERLTGQASEPRKAAPRPADRIVETYPYHDEQNQLLFEVVRFDPKRFAQRRPDGKGGWVWSLRGVRRVLYRLPDLAEAALVVICEGERDAEALRKRGFIATTCPQGAGKWRTDYNASLQGKRVVILPDNDAPGRAHAEDVAKALQGIAAGVKVLELPGLPEKGDVSDWLAAGGTAEELLRLVAEAPEWKPGATAPNPEPTAPPRTVELVDEAPETIRRPLSLVGGHAYAAAWPWVRITDHQTVDAQGRQVIHDPPLVRDEQVLAVVRGDGALFSDGPLPGALPLADLGVTVHLPETPPADQTWSGGGLRRFLAGERPDPAAVFRQVAEVVDRFMDFNRSLAPQATVCELAACYVLATYGLDAFNVFPYLWPNGDRGAGKTHFLNTAASMAYLGQVILAGGSYASLRDLADYGATLAFDDAENVMDVKKGDPDKRTLLLAGNRRGVTITIKEPLGKRGWVTRHINAFCPRLFSAIRLPDAVLASRTIIIPLVRSGDPRKANADPCDVSAWPHNRRRLIDDLWAVGLVALPKLKAHDKAAAAKARLSGRNLEPWRAILAVALWLQEEHGAAGLFERMEALSIAYQGERADLETADPSRVAILALRDMAASSLTAMFGFKTAELVEQMNRLAEKLELVQGEGEKFTNGRRVGKLLSRLRFQRSARGEDRRGWTASKAEIEALARSYGMGSPVREPNGGNGGNGEMAVTGANGAAVSPFEPFPPFQSEGGAPAQEERREPEPWELEL